MNDSESSSFIAKPIISFSEWHCLIIDRLCDLRVLETAVCVHELRLEV
jgi:hypothetical protein